MHAESVGGRGMHGFYGPRHFEGREGAGGQDRPVSICRFFENAVPHRLVTQSEFV